MGERVYPHLAPADLEKLNALAEEIEAFEIDHVDKTKAAAFKTIKGLLVGALYSLYLTRSEDWPKLDKWPPTMLSDIARGLPAGDLPEPGEWLTGYHVNNALVRIAAGYHDAAIWRFWWEDPSLDNIRKHGTPPLWKLLKNGEEKDHITKDDPRLSRLQAVRSDVEKFKHRMPDLGAEGRDVKDPIEVVETCRDLMKFTKGPTVRD